MALIDLRNASKKFGEKIVLEQVNFSVQENEKIAIIGKNGEGKSTFLKILLGSLALDDGRIIRQNNKSIAFLNQNVEFEKSISINELIQQELNEIYSSLAQYNLLQEKLAKEPENTLLLKEIDRVIAFIESKDAWNIEVKIDRILKEFGLLDFKQSPVCTLSGGEIRRIGLCILLLQNPDILLLDEPTNHLDIAMTDFLEKILKSSKMCVIFISHDRHFIDTVAEKCVELEAGKITVFQGGYMQYLNKKNQLLQSLTKSYETLLKHLKSEEEWLKRGVKARLKRNEGRKERILKMREQAKKNPNEIKKLRLELSRAALNANSENKFNRRKMLFELKNVSKIIAKRVLFKDFNARILQGERIAIVGKNGCGKSTFLKMLLGHMQDYDGEIQRAELEMGYFDQAKSLINTNKTLLEIFCPNGGDRVQIGEKNMNIYGYLKSFLFPKEFLQTNVGVLSGGEKSRLALALLFTKKYDVLILDEPTNDLDLATINILEEYLLDFKGAILFASHDRYFVDKIANKMYIFEDENIEIVHTSYTEYLELKDDLDGFEYFVSTLKNEKNTKLNLKEKKTQKLSYKENEILEKYPDQIENLEREIVSLNSQLYETKEYTDRDIVAVYERLQQAQNKLESLEKAYFEVLEKTNF
ncbi:ABC-F family ATP-binding cassette domain-containing protein [Campylobacter sp. MIT 21-1685]|uniref:ribosomal protection-like ABC-F family protein n=1 Tax=unclassified Campylobacter TaxID=2593542 RepID=UPI00224AA2C8|nr:MULTISPECIES: ABC-F family ATP-binding cassette domain-containing protein [unclassified Campylobacter]MCX2682975.1 ABC-F family ATP-binding cassette domain-containing protein [Campylobacter sp. MIT 21-1684]MCX2751257.1 ABC-F family ATP-binding cassette domain-containing protein [Campylobacter sp. MIT 21-1682]MCX2807456.1 ABC-F family ATP-binding cassette domain-containing protein [Campylobacter sp. MIT 21-1685]